MEYSVYSGYKILTTLKGSSLAVLLSKTCHTSTEELMMQVFHFSLILHCHLVCKGLYVAIIHSIMIVNMRQL